MYSISTVTKIAKLANATVRDARTLKNLLIEAGEFEPELLVNSLVKGRTLDITELLNDAKPVKAYKPVVDDGIEFANEDEFANDFVMNGKAALADYGKMNGKHD